MRSDTMEKWRGAHPAIALFVFGVACAMTFGEASAQVATFTTQQYPLLGNTHIAADFNGDGRPDLAGAGANAVSVMLGNGDGTFRAKTDCPVGTQTQAVAAGDFNSDGKVDLVVTLNSPQFSLALLTGTGTGSFNAPTFFPNTSGFDSPAIVATDLNGDGRLDLVVMHSIACFTAPCRAARSNTILLGNGNGTFQVRSRIQIDETFAPLHVVVADYNRDGFLDIARTMGDGTNGLLQILRGNGDGTFQAPNGYLVPPPVSSRGGIVIIAGDWNADAKPDIAFVEGGAGAPTIDVLTNTTGGVPPTPTPTPAPTPTPTPVPTPTPTP